MPIVEAELKYKYTGAATHDAAQTDPNASLGGHRASSDIPTGVDENLFDDVDGDESRAGMIDYRAVGFLNINALLDLISTVVWIEVDTGNSYDEISFDVEAPSDPTIGTIQLIPNENTTPGGLGGWSVATSKATGKDCPLVDETVGAGEWFGIWYRRIVFAGAGAVIGESVTIRVEGETEP
jgi:hypothetical protein